MNYLYFGALGGSFEQAKSRMEKECGVSIEKSADIHLFLNEGKTFGVDLAERVGDILCDTPAGEKHYILISDFAKCTEDCQNMLLKALEDGKDVDFYLLSSSENILPTVKSRCKCIKMLRSFEEFCSLYTGNTPLESYFITDGDLTEPEPDLVNIFQGVKKALNNGGQDLFPVLHLVKEKDKDAFPTRYAPYMKGLIRYIGRLLSESHNNAEALVLTLDELKKVEKQGYSKDDFFCYIAKLAFTL